MTKNKQKIITPEEYFKSLDTDIKTALHNMITSESEKQIIDALTKIREKIELSLREMEGGNTLVVLVEKAKERDESLEKIVKIILNASDSIKVKIEALETLNYLETRKYVRDLYTLGEPGATEKRMFAIEQLLRLNARIAAPEIAKLLLTETVKEVKKIAIQALFMLRNPNAIYYLEQALKTEEDKEIKTDLMNTIRYLNSLK